MEKLIDSVKRMITSDDTMMSSDAPSAAQELMPKSDRSNSAVVSEDDRQQKVCVVDPCVRSTTITERNRSVANLLNGLGDVKPPKNAQDAASLQLGEFQQSQKMSQTMTMSNGAPVANRHTSLTVGQRGPMLLQDVLLLDELGHFDRERVAERVVHAKGGGAHGYFELTDDISNYCKAELFGEVGRRTPVFVRFSTVIGESGSPDTARDPRGFAIKFYTQEGNWDLVANNTPIFFVRDPLLFPMFIHSLKRNPVTHLKDPDMFWDFLTSRPESTHQVMFLFSDRGTPDGFRHMHGFGSHAFKLINRNNEAVYCKFHLLTDQKIKNLSVAEANSLAAFDPDYAIRDLYNAIEHGDYPSWTFYMQVMTFDQAERQPFNPFDVTKVWPHGQFPLMRVGRLVLNRNPLNYFAEVEQSAFSPARLVPGIEPSPDKMLQGRLFSYQDTQFHRLGKNYQQLPINCPFRVRVSNYQRDGPATVDGNQGGAPVYFPNSFNGPVAKPDAAESRFSLAGDVHRFDDSDADNFSQPQAFWHRILNEPERQRLVENIADHAKGAKPHIQQRVVQMFTNVDEEFGLRLQQTLSYFNSQKASERNKSSAEQMIFIVK